MILGWECAGCGSIYSRKTRKSAPERCIKCKETVFIRLFGDIYADGGGGNSMYYSEKSDKINDLPEDQLHKDLDQIQPDYEFYRPDDGGEEEWLYDHWIPFNDQIFILDDLTQYFGV